MFVYAQIDKSSQNGWDGWWVYSAWPCSRPILVSYCAFRGDAVKARWHIAEHALESAPVIPAAIVRRLQREAERMVESMFHRMKALGDRRAADLHDMRLVLESFGPEFLSEIGPTASSEDMGQRNPDRAVERLVEENRRLRALLVTHGIDPDED